MRARAHLLADRRGLSSAEYVIILSLIALACILGWQRFGAQLGEEVAEASDCIGSTTGAACGSGEGGTPSALAGPAAGDVTQAAAALSDPWARLPGPRNDPAMPAGQDATYGRLPGRPFIYAAGDGTPVHPNDVHQGQLGDCGFVSSIAAVARANPALIQRMIRDNGNGTYTVTFQDCGIFRCTPKEITVSGEFPQKNGAPVFARGADRDGDQQELWPSILEKAYAKWQGGYPSIEGTHPSDALTAITGKSSEMWGGRNWHKWFGWTPPMDRIRGWLDNGGAVTAGTVPSGTEESKAAIFKNGRLVANHEYYVVGVDERARTVTLRNPWGWDAGEITVTYDEFKESFRSLVHNPVR